ncbi:helix-turn-helix domain-containing protein [Citricoccus sp. NPDC055426]|uniref:helix-turn-helix domain-containing protein n=1 Tax=Citricoccus sp. NPDC055426 TaxID=3155536 RepID=UPI00343DC556
MQDTQKRKSANIGTAETARILRVSKRTVHNRVDAGILTPITKIEGRTGAYVFDRETVQALADAQQESATS